MAVLYDRPFAFILGNTLVNLVAWRSLFTLYENSGIDGVLQNTDDRTRRPSSFCIGFEGSGELHSKGAFVLHR